MNSEVAALLEKAKRSQKVAAKLFKDGDVDFAASRAYYSLFYRLKLFYCLVTFLFRVTLR